MGEEKVFVVKLVNIEVNSIDLKEPTESVVSVKEFFFNFEIQTRINTEKRLIVNIQKLKISDKANLENVFATLLIAFSFEVDNFNDGVQKNAQEKYEVNVNLDKKLTLIGLNTLRGIAFSAFKTTYLNNIIIPILEEDSLKRVT